MKTMLALLAVAVAALILVPGLATACAGTAGRWFNYAWANYNSPLTLAVIVIVLVSAAGLSTHRGRW